MPMDDNEKAAYDAAIAESNRLKFEIALAKRGITDADDADVIVHRYNRTPEKDRPAFDAWLNDAIKSDRAVKLIHDATRPKEPAKIQFPDGARNADPAPPAVKSEAPAPPAVKSEPPITTREPGTPADSAGAKAAVHKWTPEKVQSLSTKALREQIGDIRQDWGFGGEGN